MSLKTEEVEMSLKISVESTDGVSVLSFTGELVQATRSILEKRIQKISAKGIILDLTNVDDIDQYGAVAIKQLCTALNTANRGFAVVASSKTKCTTLS